MSVEALVKIPPMHAVAKAITTAIVLLETMAWSREMRKMGERQTRAEPATVTSLESVYFEGSS